MRDSSVKFPRGIAVESREEAHGVAPAFENSDIVAKAQVLADIRGLGTFKNGFSGGVHISYSPEGSAVVTESMIGKNLFSKQSGQQGGLWSKALVDELVYSHREKHLSITYNRAFQDPFIVVFFVGGTA